MEGRSEFFSSNSFTFYDMSPRVFEKIRYLSGVNPKEYRKSLHPYTFLKFLDNQKFTDGRSGSYFCFSPDKKFILKTVPCSESRLLYDIMWDYYQHLSENPDTLLLRFYGSYALKPPHAHSIYIVVFQNVFNTSKNLHETYDLKGSWVNRGGGKEQVLNSSNKELKKTGKDLDFNQIVSIGPTYSRQLQHILQKDSELLKRLNIMDYSLLVGIHYVNRVDIELSDKSSNPTSETNIDFFANHLR
eukprot:TRINITY_DN8120_c0_g1_i12.p1 TRINITY_DN8120_c0_g1~~TRINITY_DN8120_c0_g1_i12.p1  ORF type:complete len:244 (-),score=35.32 TRINITY_DN8120_c0_g1_i12:273-1004(-)